MTLRTGFVALVASILFSVGACSSNPSGPPSGDGRGGATSGSCAVGLGTCGSACVDLRAPGMRGTDCWSGNDASTANLNIVNDFSTSLTASWGRQVMADHAASIQLTAARASIFAP